MVKTSHRAVVFAVVACVGMLGGCDDAPSEAKPGAASAQKKAAASKAGGVPADMVAAVSAGKGSAAIGVHFALRAQPAVNSPLPVDVAIVPHRKFDLVSVRFEGRDGLATTAGEEFGPKNNVESESVLTHQIVLLPSKEGIAMVIASVETEGDDGNVVRTYSIPVIVSGTPTPAPAAHASPATPADAPPAN